MALRWSLTRVVPDRKAPIAELEPILTVLRFSIKTPITQVFNKDGSVRTVEVPEDAARGFA